MFGEEVRGNFVREGHELVFGKVGFCKRRMSGEQRDWGETVFGIARGEVCERVEHVCVDLGRVPLKRDSIGEEREGRVRFVLEVFDQRLEGVHRHVGFEFLQGRGLDGDILGNGTLERDFSARNASRLSSVVVAVWMRMTSFSIWKRGMEGGWGMVEAIGLTVAEPPPSWPPACAPSTFFSPVFSMETIVLS